MSRIAAIILAAGQASRFRAAAGEAGPATKLVAQLEGKPLVRHVAEAALASRAAPIIVVTGHAEEVVRAALEGLPLTFTHNDAYASGLASSLQQGLSCAPSDCDGALVLLGDMPLVSPEIIEQLIDAFARNPATKAVAPHARMPAAAAAGKSVITAPALPHVARQATSSRPVVPSSLVPTASSRTTRAVRPSAVPAPRC